MEKTVSTPSLFFIMAVLAVALHIFCSKENSTFGKPALSSSDTITVMSYNVENLFDLQDNGTEYPDYIPNRHNWNRETHAAKLDNIGSAIAAADADILVLAEVENLAAAIQLKKVLARKKCAYPYIAAGDKPNPATTCQVILSRFPVTFSQGHGIPKSGDYYTRNILEADITLNDHVLKIFAVHFPSKRYCESYRMKAAKVLHKKLQELPVHTEYILAGDFNSNYNEAETFFTEKLDDTKGATAINHLFKTVQSSPGDFIDYVTEQELIAHSDSLYHYNPWLELPNYRRLSYVYHGQNNTLDHILLPRTLYDNTGISYVDNSFSIFTWNGRLMYNGAPYRWKMIYGRKGKTHVGKGYSDHLPIMARFVLHPFSFADSTRRKNHEAASFTEAGVIGFETGVEGWMPYNRYFRLVRDTVNTSSGRYSLKIEGLAGKSVGAAHCRLPINKTATGAPKTISFDLRGSGRFAFRIQIDDNKKICYTGKDFKKQIKSTRYTTHSFRTWQRINLMLPPSTENAEVVELEIRVAGKEVLCLWIDNVRVQQSGL